MAAVITASRQPGLPAEKKIVLMEDIYRVHAKIRKAESTEMAQTLGLHRFAFSGSRVDGV
jgi:hypothetical protein